MKMKLVSVLISVFVALFIVSVAIALPILIRPFYYLQIESLGIPQKTGLTFSEIKVAYDEMLDYCLGLRADFSAGVLWYSEEGVSHFNDVRVLFFLDFAIIIVSAVALAVIAIVLKITRRTPYRFLGRSAPFWSVASIGAICAVIGVACAINFRETFVFLHKIVFIGKTNWSFKPSQDPIIFLLPNQFFSNCAMFIFSVIMVFAIAILVNEFVTRENNKMI